MKNQVDKAASKMTEEFPEGVQSAIRELAREPGITSIWLIGSRANHCARNDSDWDLLVFSNADPIPTQCRFDGIDVLRAGPSGKVLLEGQSQDYEVRFSDFQWRQLSEWHAQYRGNKLIEYPVGQVINYSAPRRERCILDAFRVWPPPA